MNSFDVAKRLALTQNKMLFVMWEDAYEKPYPGFINDDQGNSYYIKDFFRNDFLNSKIWEYFVPVILKESQHLSLFNQIKDKRSITYIDRFNDDFVKIMDVNGNILNINILYSRNFLKFLQTYALNTSYLSIELRNYKKEQNLNTSYQLAVKYIDYAIYNKEELRLEIIDLSSIYLKEAEQFLESENPKNKSVILNRIGLQKIKQQIVLNNIRKAKRQLKRLKDVNFQKLNQPLYAFLNFTVLTLLDDDEAQQWKAKVRIPDLNKTRLLLNNKLNSIGNNN
ncbi:MAG: hypothetical protein HKO92_09415 [Flavobacteriaceae bacterium]|nr:hypothetical protein [Flavobacteriaceae bacterium]